MRFPKAFRERPLLARAGVIVLVFVGFSLLWIPITDQILGWLVQDPVQLTRLSTYKGSLYIVIVALFLFWLVVSALETTREERQGDSTWSGTGEPLAPELRSLWAPLALFTAVALLLLCLGALVYQAQRRRVEQMTQGELAEYSRIQANQIDGWLQERKSDALIESKDPSLPPQLQRLVREPRLAGRIRSVLSERMKTLRDSYRCDSIKLTDAEGKVLAASDGEDLDPAEAQAIQRLSGAETVVLAWYLRPGREHGPVVQMSWCAAVKNLNEAGTLGVLVFRLSLDRQLAQTLRNLPTYHSSLETLLLCQQGDDLIFLTPTRLSDRPVAWMPMARKELVGVQAMAAGEGVFQGVDYRGVPSIAASSRLASLPWVLLAKLDEAELSIPLQRLSMIFGGVALLFLALASITFFVWRKRERLIVRAEQQRMQAENQLLEYRLEFLNQHANDVVLLVEPTGRIRYANDRAVDAYGYTQQQLTELSLQDLRAPDQLGELPGQLATALETGSLRFETVHRRKDGALFPVEVSSRSLILAEGPCIQSIIRDVSERKQAEHELQASGERYRRLFDEAVEGIALADVERDVLVDCNQAFLKLAGRERSAVIGTSLATFHAPQYLQALRERIRLILDGAPQTESFTSRLLTGAGTERDVEIKVNRIELDGRWLALGFFRDLTQERQREFEQDTTLNLQRLLTERNQTHELMGQLTRFIQDWSGCEAVGIRLREGDDFPYFETRGFPSEFVALERYLCVRDLAGQVLRDELGHPLLECMCGNILCRRFDPAKPFFSPNGSFWSNCTTDLLASTTAQDRQASTRNRCNGEGYESVALIPLRSGEDVFGLLQLNDHARDRFTPERIAFLEGLGSQIALALAKRQALDALERSENRLRVLSEAAGEFLWETGPDGRFTFISERITDILGYTPEELIGRDPYAFVALGEAEQLKSLLGGARTFRNREVPLLAKSGRIVWASITRVLKQDGDGQASGYFGAGLDITERKESERQLRESERKMANLLGNLPGFVYRCANDPHWTMEFISEGCLAITGYAPVDFLGNRKLAFSEIIRPDFQESVWRAWQQVLDLEQTYEGEYPITTAAGETRWVWERGNGVRDAEGRPRFLEGFITDITDRKRAETSLLESEARNRALISAIPDLLFTNRRDGEFLDLHVPDPSLLYAPLESFLHRQPKDVMPGPLAERFLQAFADALDTGSVQELNYSLPLQGQERHFEARVVPCTRDTVISILRETTERKQAEAAMWTLTARLRTLIDTIPDLIWLKDPEGVYLQCNRRFEHFFGGLEQDIVGKTDYDFVDRAQADDFREHDRIAMAAGKRSMNEEVVRFANDGHQELLETIKTPIFGSDGTLLGVLGIGRDITERRRAEETLRANEAKLDLALRSARMGVWTWDVQGNRRHFDERVCRLLGIDGAAFTGSQDEFLSVVEPEDRDIVRTAWAKTFDENLPYEAEYRVRWPSGSIHYIHSRGRLLRDDSGRPLRLNGILWDVTEQREAAASLKASEEQYRRLFDTMKEGFALHELITDESGRAIDYRFLEVNPAFEAMTGVSRERWLGHTVLELMPQVEPYWIETYGRVALTGEPERLENYSAALDRWFQVFAFCPAPRQFAVLTSDITERKQAELALLKSERFLQEAQRVGRIGCYSLDIASGRWESSESLDDIFGIGLSYPRDVEGWLQLVTPEDRAAMGEYLEALIRDRTRFSRDYRILRPQDGRERWVSGLGMLEFDGDRPVRMLGTIQDITDWKQAEMELLSRTELLNLTGSLAKVGGWEFDPKTLKGTWTDEVARIHDLDPRLETNAEIGLSLYTPESRLRIDAAIAAAVTAGTPYDLELELLSAKGVRKDVRSIGLPVLDERGAVTKIRGIFQDITERKVAEIVIRRMTEELEQRVVERTAQLEATNKELEAFSYSVSHDLRGPLRGIDGFSRALAEDYQEHLDETGRHYLERIRAGTQRMGQLIDDLLKLSRVNRSDLTLQDVDLSSLCTKILEELARTSPDRQVACSVEPGLQAQADRRLLLVVLENLLRNAWKFTSRRTSATIEVGRLPSAEGERVFFIRDNGAGFDRLYVDKLFNAFQRLHTADEFEGTGIGLAIVQRIIHRHGGRVWAEGDVGEGATFCFSLPEDRIFDGSEQPSVHSVTDD